MLEDIRKQCMQHNAKRSIISNMLRTRYTNRALVEIELSRFKCKDCIRQMSIGDLHEIKYHGVAYQVDIVPKFWLRKVAIELYIVHSYHLC